MRILERPIKFKHFKREELEIFKDWLAETKPDGYIETDVHLETPESLEILRRYPDYPPAFRRPAMKRIDAVWYRPDEIYLLEIKERIRHSAIGELLTYRQLFSEQRRPMKPLRLGIIARHKDLAVQAACKSLGIHFWLV